MRLFLADEEESSTTILKTTVVSVKTQGHREQTLNCCCFDCCFGVGGVGAEATMTAAMKAAAAAAAVPSVDFTLSNASSRCRCDADVMLVQSLSVCQRQLLQLCRTLLLCRRELRLRRLLLNVPCLTLSFDFASSSSSCWMRRRRRRSEKEKGDREKIWERPRE